MRTFAGVMSYFLAISRTIGFWRTGGSGSDWAKEGFVFPSGLYAVTCRPSYLLRIIYPNSTAYLSVKVHERPLR